MSQQRYRLVMYRSASGREPVAEWLDRLDPRQRAKVLWALGRLAEDGLRLGPPLLRKLDDDLWEVRVAARGSALRVLLCPERGTDFVLLEAFSKKSPKTPERALRTARLRLMQHRERQP